MKSILFLGFLAAGIPALAQLPASPDVVYGKLFRDVQLAPVFPDQKTFADAIPRKAPAAIVAEYQKATSNPAIRFALDLFVQQNFSFYQEPQLNYFRQETDILQHIRNCWVVLQREPEKAVDGSSLLPLPYTYITTGGRFRELNYSTAYFAMLGLKESGRADMIENMVKDIAAMIDSVGFVPAGNRSYLLDRSGPPYFAMMVELLAGIKGGDIYLTYLPELEKEYGYWMEGATGCKPGQASKRVVRMKDGALLNRYFDEVNTPRPEHYKNDVATAQQAESDKNIIYLQLRAADAGGWEASSRWRLQATNSGSQQALAMIPVDLNCLLYKLERVLARARTLQGRDSAATVFRKKADDRAYAIDKYCWNKTLNFYTDYNYALHKQVNVITPAGLFPFCVYETKPDYMSLLASRVAAVVKDKLLKEGGLQNSDRLTGLDMDAPYGVAALQWMAVYGLDRCGQKDLARDIAQRWTKLVSAVFKRSGKLLEKYNVAEPAAAANSGDGLSISGYSATNGVMMQLSALYGTPTQ